MKRKFCLFVIVLLIGGLPGFSEETIHVLQKGETIFSVARFYGVSPQAVLSLNGLTEAAAHTVQAGRRLRIPETASGAAANTASGAASGTAANTASRYTEYRVVRGDTLYSIARRGGVSVAELLALNGYPSSYVLKEGDRIKIPGAALGTVAAGSSGGAVKDAAKVDTQVKWPVAPRDISYMTGKLYGVMVTGDHSESVKSLTQGTVVSAGPYRGFGRVAIVQMSGGYLYVYGGCETLSVKEGDRVLPGSELGKLGVDTKSQKPQLFFLVYRSNTPIDPAKAPRA